MTVLRLEQPEKAYSLIEVSKDVLPTDVRLLQLEKADSPRVAQLLRSTDYKE